MPHIAQHQAAELWELCRDHAVAGAKLRALASCCQDQQLHHTLQRHAGEFQQAAQRLMQFLHEPGSYAGGYAGSWQWPSSVTWQTPGQASWQGGASAQWQAQSYPAGTNQVAGAAGAATQASGQALDIALASDCLRMCKTFAVQCIWGATESSEPARSYLYQLAGEHLRMAQEHYRWLEQRGVYASPRVDQPSINEYTQKLQQIMQMGQAVASQGLVPGGAARSYAAAGTPYGTTTSDSIYAGASSPYQAGGNQAGTGHAYAAPAAYGRA